MWTRKLVRMDGAGMVAVGAPNAADDCWHGTGAYSRMICPDGDWCRGKEGERPERDVCAVVCRGAAAMARSLLGNGGRRP